MSGICGLISRDGLPVDQQLLKKLTDFLAFRGPDAQTTWAKGPAGFGHTLLKTTFEAENERQPCSLDGQVWITADARIDSQGELKAKLGSKGRQISPGISDAELILHAYHVWGESCLEHLLGDFAFAIWDGNHKELFCARDHFGVKPFYYSDTANNFIFSNTLNCLRKHPDVSATLNDRAIGDFLLFDYNCDPATTTFTDIQRLPAAHHLTWSDGRVRVNRYWKLPIPEQIKYRQSSQYVEHFRELLRNAVGDRLRTDRVGVSMSGGLDSTSIAATALSILQKTGRAFDLRAQAVVYDRLIPDKERYYAGLVAEKLGIPVRFLSADGYMPYERRAEAALRRPEPVHNLDLSIWVDELRYLSAHSRVVLTGWDGDAILAESPKPYLCSLAKNYQLGPLAASIFWLLWHRHQQLQKSLVIRMNKLRGAKVDYVWDDYFPVWLNDTFSKRLRLRERWAEMHEVIQPQHTTRPYAVRTLSTSYLWQDLLGAFDSGVSNFPLEFRHPLLDLRMIDFCLSLPPIPWCAGKELFRAAMHDILPAEILRRPKEPLAGYPYLNKLQQQQSLEWLDGFVPVPELASYVDRKLRPRVGGETDPNRAWINLRPYSLNNWLQYAEHANS